MAEALDLTGHKYGRLTVIRKADLHVTPQGRNIHMWDCVCECGNNVTVTANNLRKGNTTSCGCYRLENLAKDLSGQRFGRLIVVSRDGSNARGDARWKCKCDCGNYKTIIRSALISGRTQSCGCLQSEKGYEQGKKSARHGMSETRLYNVWCGMKKRTSETADDRHKRDYYDRGIRTCNEWLHSFEAFRDWALANGYSESLQIDRKDNDGNYSPENCQWVTGAINSRNRRARSESKLKVKGVSLSSSGSYNVAIGADGKSIWIGTFKTIDEAMRARAEAENKYW